MLELGDICNGKWSRGLFCARTKWEHEGIRTRSSEKELEICMSKNVFLSKATEDWRENNWNLPSLMIPVPLEQIHEEVALTA
jgi:hypothetical protein